MQINKDKIEQISTRSDFFQDILDKIPSRIITWGSSGILIIFFLIFIGLRLIKYPDVIASQALVTTEKPPVEIFSRTSGRIIHILKKDQEKVKSGEWIFILNNSANYIDVLKAKKLLNAINPGDFWNSINKIKFDEFLMLGDIQSTYNAFHQSLNELNSFIELNSQNKQLDINLSRRDNLILLEQELTKQIILREKECDIVKSDFERIQLLYKQESVAKIDVEQKEVAFLNTKNKIEDAKISLLNIKQQQDMLRKENVSLEIEKNDTYLKLKNAVLLYYNNIIFELSEWQNKYVLSSPIDGNLNLYDIRSEGQFLANEKKVFTIIPSYSQNYFAIVQLPISNSGKVHLGQSCIIKLHNYSFTEFGMLKGTVQSISSAPKEGFYSVKVSLPNQLISTLHKQLITKSDLSGEAEIIIENMTLFDRIFNSLISKNY